jgi:Protein of unknown function (DUF721).
MKTIGDYLSEYIGSIDIEKTPYVVFQSLIDPKLKNRVEFEELSNGVLYVSFTHPSYKQLFKMGERTFLKRIQMELPNEHIKAIKYKN